MFVQLNSNVGPVVETEFCVIGAGAAGIALARKLSAAGHNCVLAEAGDLEVSHDSQDVYQGRVVGDDYYFLDAARLRYFGGSTNHWAGWCRTLDASDFEARKASPIAAWPISKSDLQPYEKEAFEILELPALKPDRPLNEEGTVTQLDWIISDPVRFNEKFRGELDASEKCTVLLNANLIEVGLNDGALEEATFVNYLGDRVSVRAKTFVLACGGIENSRLLLHLNRAHGNAIGNQRELVGRYWMEHPRYVVGAFAMLEPSFLNFDKEWVSDIRIASTSAAFREANEIMACNVRFDAVPYDGSKKIVGDLLCVAPSLGSRVMAMMGKDLFCGGRVSVASEQEPQADNRVTLDEQDVDKFGMPRPVLHWKKSALVRKTVSTTMKAMATHFAEVDEARLQLADWILDDTLPITEDIHMAGHHHMGGTRMSADALTGVVDKDCRVFGVPNLYVAGSSVFSSGGHANPTVTITQLSLRLADHLLNRASVTAADAAENAATSPAAEPAAAQGI